MLNLINTNINGKNNKENYKKLQENKEEKNNITKKLNIETEKSNEKNDNVDFHFFVFIFRV